MSSAKKPRLDMTPGCSVLHKIPFSAIPPELIRQILQKLKPKCFIPMYKTCSSMGPMVEECLKKYKYEDVTIARFGKLILGATKGKISIEIEIFNKDRKRTFSSSVIDSFIWKFVQIDCIEMQNDWSADRYLDIMSHRKFPHDKRWLTTENCPLPMIINAMRTLKPSNMWIRGDVIGDLREILLNFPICAINKKIRAQLRVNSSLASDADEYLRENSFEIIENVLQPTPIMRHLLIKSPCGHYFDLTITNYFIFCKHTVMNP